MGKWGGGPDAVVKAACLESRRFEHQNTFSRSLVKIQYCGKSPWLRGSVLRLAFGILCLEGSVISFISPSSEGFPGPI